MRRMWFGLEIDVVGLPPLSGEYIGNFSKRGGAKIPKLFLLFFTQ